MAEQKEQEDVITALAERIPKMLDLMPGETRVQQLACFLTIVGGGADVGKREFIQACNMAAQALEQAQRHGKAKQAENN